MKWYERFAVGLFAFIWTRNKVGHQTALFGETIFRRTQKSDEKTLCPSRVRQQSSSAAFLWVCSLAGQRAGRTRKFLLASG
jgi:hypothetical protein